MHPAVPRVLRVLPAVSHSNLLFYLNDGLRSLDPRETEYKPKGGATGTAFLLPGRLQC